MLRYIRGHLVEPRTLCSFFAVALFLSLPSFAMAGAQVTPLVMNRIVEARDILTETITVVNTQGSPTMYFPMVNNVSLNAGGGIEAFVDASMSDRTRSLASWLELNRLPLEMKAGEKRELPLTIRVNPEAVPGVYSAFVSFPEGSNQDEARARMLQGSVAGVVVTVTIEDDSSTVADVSRFLISRIVSETENEAVTYVVHNEGDTEVLPEGDIIIYNQRGEEVSSVALNPEGRRLSPGSTETFKSRLPIDGLFGKYKAQLSLRYGEGPQRALVTDTAFFYALPLTTLIFIFGALVVLAVVTSLFIHRRMERGGQSDEFGEDVPLFFRAGVSDSKHHDVDLKSRKD